MKTLFRIVVCIMFIIPFLIFLSGCAFYLAMEDLFTGTKYGS